ncbi:MAG TPA: hypothetical protein VHT75_14065 [Acidimicrobiales bacterium]|nr:hypothetical protein [Acidimicrobiales bacterium]
MPTVIVAGATATETVGCDEAAGTVDDEPPPASGVVVGVVFDGIEVAELPKPPTCWPEPDAWWDELPDRELELGTRATR